ncbi:MAG: hypothetical protein M1820_003833 [Bogoriella megaspora]|nr:MAG: hypothetical protein M1820_003833 [Bogoriella megaspora]
MISERNFLNLNGIDTLCQHAFTPGKDQNCPREALRCLANAFLLKKECRQVFVNKEYGPKAAERFKASDLQYEYTDHIILTMI